jgi:hypothetical protein
MSSKAAMTAPLPEEAAIAARYQGFIDAVTHGRIYGWALDTQTPEQPVSIDLFHGERLLATVIANQARDDLPQHTGGRANHAFEYVLPDGLRDDPPSRFSACYAGTSVPLLRGPGCRQENGADGDTLPQELMKRIDNLELMVVTILRKLQDADAEPEAATPAEPQPEEQPSTRLGIAEMKLKTLEAQVASLQNQPGKPSHEAVPGAITDRLPQIAVGMAGLALLLALIGLVA